MNLSIQSDRLENCRVSGGWHRYSVLGVLMLFALLLLTTQPVHGASRHIVTETTETLVYDLSEPSAPTTPVAASPGQFGPFRVIAPDTVEMTGTVDSYTPAVFLKMLNQYPGIRLIQMLDCDGSVDEEANLKLARMIRHAGISTNVPAHGSVRSGAVDLFLAGVSRTADPDAEFIVHSWMDENGLEAEDYPANDPVHAEYLDYYTEMGVPILTAKAFYAFSISVPFSGQLRMSRRDLTRFQFFH